MRSAFRPGIAARRRVAGDREPVRGPDSRAAGRTDQHRRARWARGAPAPPELLHDRRRRRQRRRPGRRRWRRRRRRGLGGPAMPTCWPRFRSSRRARFATSSTPAPIRITSAATRRSPRQGRRCSRIAGSIALPGNFLGGVASILSAEKVLSRMSAPTGKTSPFPAGAWPTETFDHARKYMFLNGEGIEILHQPAAHTDGDVVVFFRRSDVVVAGDILDTTRFPVIDVARGGTIDGEIAALNRDRRSGDSIRPDRLARSRHDRDPRARTAVRSARRRGIPRHGQHHSRPRSRSDGGRHDARPDQGRVAGARVHAAIRVGFRSMDDEQLHRGDPPEPPAGEAMSALRSLVVALIARSRACALRSDPGVPNPGSRGIRPGARWCAPRRQHGASGSADRSDGILGRRRQRGLALPDGDAAEGRLPWCSDHEGSAADRERVGPGGRRSGGRAMQVCTAPRRSCAFPRDSTSPGRTTTRCVSTSMLARRRVCSALTASGAAPTAASRRGRATRQRSGSGQADAAVLRREDR